MKALVLYTHTHTHTHTHTSIFIQRVFVQLQEKRYIANKVNGIKKEAILYRKVIGIINSAYHFI